MLIALADQSDDNGVSWPSIRYLSRKTGLSKSVVERTIFYLNGPKQLVYCVKRQREDGGNTSNVYRLNLANVPLWQDDEVAQMLRAGDYSMLIPPVPPKRDTLSHPVGTPCPAAMTPAEEPSLNPQLTKTPLALFDRFWSAYPKKRNRGTAERAFKRLAPDDALLETLLAAIARQNRSDAWLADGGKFIPHPGSWLNGRRWEDQEVVEFSSAPPRPAVLAEMEKEIAATPTGRRAGLAELKGALKRGETP